MSQRSKYSKYSARGKSLGAKRDGYKHLENIPEKDELNYEEKQCKCHVCENELTKEELTFNEQIISYRQGKESSNKDYERQQNSDKISEIGNNIIMNNLKRISDPTNFNPEEFPILCAKCMYDLYMSKGIVPQMKDATSNEAKQRSHSDSRGGRALTNEELNRKIQKEMIIAKHLGENSPSIPITAKPHLISVAQKTFGGYDFKPSMWPKQNNLKSNFADLAGATDVLDKQKFDLSKTVAEGLLPLRSSVNPEELYERLKDFKPEFTVSTSREEFGWTPFQHMKVDRHFHRKKNDISIFSDAKFKGGVFHLSSLDLPRRPNTSEKFL